MSHGVNKVILIGNLGAEPAVKMTANGIAMLTTSLATNRSWKDKDSGEMKTATEWHRLVLFNRLAEIVGQYLHKGSKIYVEGSLRTRKWQDTNGIERYTTEIVVNEMHMLDKPGSSEHGVLKTQTPTNATNSLATSSFGSSMTPNPKIIMEPIKEAVPAYDDDIPF